MVLENLSNGTQITRMEQMRADFFIQKNHRNPRPAFSTQSAQRGRGRRGVSLVERIFSKIALRSLRITSSAHSAYSFPCVLCVRKCIFSRRKIITNPPNPESLRYRDYVAPLGAGITIRVLLLKNTCSLCYGKLQRAAAQQLLMPNRTHCYMAPIELYRYNSALFAFYLINNDTQFSLVG
jgi:hypothetical protein